MIQPRSLVKITDNTGAKIGRVFKVLGGSRRRYARIGDVVILSVQTAEPKKMLKKKDVCRAVVVRQTKPWRRRDGSYLCFDDNAAVILDKDKPEPIGSRVFGPVPHELGQLGWSKIVTLAPEVV